MIVFSGAALDRASALRRRPEWVEEQRGDPGARAVLMSAQGVVIEDGRLVMPRPGTDAVFLGLLDGAPLFAQARVTASQAFLARGCPRQKTDATVRM